MKATVFLFTLALVLLFHQHIHAQRVLKVYLGQKANFTCTPSRPLDKKVVRYEWQKPRGVFRSDKFYYVVDRISAEDGGEYYCIATLENREQRTISVRLQLQNAGPPRLGSQNQGGRLIVTPPPTHPDGKTYIRRTNEALQVMCSTGGNERPSDFQWYAVRGRQRDRIPSGGPFLNVPLVGNYAREYVCVYVPGNLERTILLEPARPNPPPPVQPVPQGCGSWQLTCRDGRSCYEPRQKCDGRRDCPDASDEYGCSRPEPPPVPGPRTCDPIDKQCLGSRDGQVFMVGWKCDGESDCANGYDEQNCPTSTRYPNCGGKEFTCNDNARTRIPMAYVCDTQNDCQNGDDEIDCEQPRIIGFRQETITVVPGGTITLTCRAQGKPIPKIVWRYNWNCLPDASRVREQWEPEPRCKTVTATLTISSARVSDAGIYNCEGLSGTKRAWSQDYIVVVR